MKRIVALVTLTLPLAVAPLTHAVDQYVGISTLGAWTSSPPMELAHCEQYVGVLVQAFMQWQIGPGDSMVQTQEMGVYKVTYKTDPKTTHMFIFKCVPILRNDDSKAKEGK